MMSDKDYYPAGAYEDPSAPYNQPSDNDSVEVDIEVAISLSRPITIYTDDYVEITEEDYDVDIDDEGNRVIYGGTSTYEDFSDTNFIKAYENDDCYILTLLEEYAKILEQDLRIIDESIEQHTNSVISQSPYHKKKMRQLYNERILLKRKIDACRGYIVDDIEVFKS